MGDHKETEKLGSSIFIYKTDFQGRHVCVQLKGRQGGLESRAWVHSGEFREVWESWQLNCTLQYKSRRRKMLKEYVRTHMCLCMHVCGMIVYDSV